MRIRSGWAAVIIIVGFIVGLSGTAQAFDLDDLDPSEWLDECNLGKALAAAGAGASLVDGVYYGATYVGTGDVLNLGGECDAADLGLVSFGIREDNLRWGAFSTATSGKLVIDLRRRYGFDTNGDLLPDVYTAYGKNWRWKNKKKGQYVKATYALAANINNGIVWMNMTGTAVPNTGSQTPASYTTWNAAVPAGYIYLQNVHISGVPTWNSPWSIYDANVGGRIWGTGKDMTGTTVVRNAAGTTRTINFPLGQIWAKSVPRNGKRFQHIVYRP